MCDTTEYREHDDLTDALIAIGSRLFKIDGDSPDGRRVYDAIEVIRTIEALRRRVAELGEKIEHYDTAEYHLSQMVKSLTAENAELKDRQKTLIEVFIYDPRQWDDKESGGTATVLACLLLEKVREFIAQHGHDPKGNVEDAFTAITAENAELKRQVEALREDAEVGRLVKSAWSSTGKPRMRLEALFHNEDGKGYWATIISGREFRNALREAAKGEVEG